MRPCVPYYDAHKADFIETCVSHILVDTKALADSLHAQIVAGGDFAALAKANSKDNQGPTGGSAAKGGDLGCLTDQESANFDAAFRAAMQALPTGQVSDVVQSQFGFHIIKVTDRRPRAFEEAKQADLRPAVVRGEQLVRRPDPRARHQGQDRGQPPVREVRQGRHLRGRPAQGAGGRHDDDRPAAARPGRPGGSAVIAVTR